MKASDGSGARENVCRQFFRCQAERWIFPIAFCLVVGKTDPGRLHWRMVPAHDLRPLPSRDRILACLEEYPFLSRKELSARTGLSRATVAVVVDGLLEAGLVTEHAPAVRENQSTGRPPALLTLPQRTRVVAGIDFDHRHVAVAVAGEVLHLRQEPLDVDHSPTSALDAAARLLAGVLESARLRPSSLDATVIAVPGPVNASSGLLEPGTILPDWQSISVQAEFRARTGIAAQIDNDANLGALGELTYGAARGRRDVIFVKLASGIGAGLIFNGEIYRGGAGGAGELGHVQVRPDGAICRCGNRGCLESVASAAAIIAALQPAHPRALELDDVVRLAMDGDIGARRVFTDAGRTIGRVLADICNVLDPQAVVLGGETGAASQLVSDGVRDSILRHARPSIGEHMEILTSTLGSEATVLGAVALAKSLARDRSPLPWPPTTVTA
jgi:predicted NBD/HSP70 family sugar kinase